MSLGTGSSDTLGEYKLSRILGEGTFGKVQLGIHIPTGQKVAIKILEKEKIVDQSDIERVTREICILKILRHPNIVQLYQIIETAASIHLVMEYAEGGELFDHIVRKKRLEEQEAVLFMQQLLSGVEYMHRNGIVHRDLKPENLLLDHKGSIKIVDFGLSNQYSSQEKLKTACGSPCYAAPEMIAGKHYDCQGVDVWSCGIILFAMLCGYLPFEDENTNRLYKKILSGHLALPKHLSEESKSILKGILNVDPEARLKIDQIRSSAWYNKGGVDYKRKGLVVSKDTIDISKGIVSKIQALGYETKDLKGYLHNNKHNSLTTLYYLLKLKTERTIEKAKEESAPKHLPSHSRPDKRDDSLNATKIISSIVQANKSKFIPFPKTEKPASNVTKNFPANLSPKVNPNQTSKQQISQREPLRKRIQTHYRQVQEGESRLKSQSVDRGNSALHFTPNRQKIKQELRQIPQKIKNTISQAHKLQGIHSPPSQEKSNTKFFHSAATSTRDKGQSFSRAIIEKGSKESPFIHVGCFNTNCLFLDNPGSLCLKVSAVLQKLGCAYRQADHLSFVLPEGQELSILSFCGVSGYSIIKFNPYTALSQQIIHYLQQ